MGYTTDFYGSLKLSRPATEKERDYINLISSTRRVKRDVNKLMSLYNGEHGNPFAKGNTPEEIYGHEGEYFAKDDNNFGQDNDGSIIDINLAPGETEFLAGRKKIKLGQPGLWCQWIVTEDGTELTWDGGEKFYNYVEWLEYYIKHFFEPWGIKLNGEIEWAGEDREDMGKIVVTDNVVKTQIAEITYKDDNDE